MDTGLEGESKVLIEVGREDAALSGDNSTGA